MWRYVNASQRTSFYYGGGVADTSNDNVPGSWVYSVQYGCYTAQSMVYFYQLKRMALGQISLCGPIEQYTPTNRTYLIYVKAGRIYPISEFWKSTNYTISLTASGLTNVNVTFFAPAMKSIYFYYEGNLNSNYSNKSSTIWFTIPSFTTQVITILNRSFISKYHFTFAFLDLDYGNVGTCVTWGLFNGTQLLTYAQGQNTLDGASLIPSRCTIIPS